LLSPTWGKCSEWLPVAERIITPTYHLVCLCGLGKLFQPGQAWYCWQKWGSASTWATALLFRPKTFQDSWESPWICETSYLQECAIEILNNSNLLKIPSLRIIYLNASSLRNEGFNHLEISGDNEFQNLPNILWLVLLMWNIFFNRERVNQYLVSLCCLEG